MMGHPALSHGDKDPRLDCHGDPWLSIHHSMLTEQENLARRTPRGHPQITAMAAYPTTLRVSLVTSPLVA